MKHPSQPILEITRLKLRRGETPILRGVSWRVLPGEHWVILGANGSGKTSLLAALTGYTTPSDGEIRLLGERFGAADWRELRRRVGFVSSSLRQMMADDEMAVDIVAGGKDAVINHWHDPSAADRRVAARLLRDAGCGRIASRVWGVLSQGERQRVLIARALMARPELLILDEPCAGLDPAAREQFLRFIERLAKQPQAPALIFVTHHVEEIMPAFTHALLLKSGKVLVAGTKRAVLKSAMLSQVFDAALRLKFTAGRYSMKLI